MIVSCPACETKFRLDEEQIPAEGAWLRCSRCRHVFLYEPVKQEEMTPHEFTMEPEEKASTRKKLPRWVWLWSPLLVVIVLLGAFFALYRPEDQALITILGRGTPEKTNAELGAPFKVKITDLRQHFVENALLGKIRVIQGSAVNTSNRFMTRIKVKAELYDVLGVKVMEGLSYCGNILSDQELATATEEEITRRLLQPLGTEVSTEKVPPQGVVPFMVVLLREPPGVEKTLVWSVEADYLLP